MSRKDNIATLSKSVQRKILPAVSERMLVASLLSNTMSYYISNILKEKHDKDGYEITRILPTGVYRPKKEENPEEVAPGVIFMDWHVPELIRIVCLYREGNFAIRLMPVDESSLRPELVAVRMEIAKTIQELAKGSGGKVVG